MKPKLLRNSSVVLVLFALLAAPLAAAAQGGVSFFVFNVDAGRFPDVSFDVRAVDLNNQPVTGLTNSTLAVFENGQPVPGAVVSPRVDGPVNVIFVIDQGRLANYNNFGLANIRLAITTLVGGGYFQDGVDTVTVMGRQNINSDQTILWLPPTKTGSDLTTFMANFNFARGTGSTKGLLGVEDAITKFQELVPAAGSQTTAIIFITRFIEDPSSTVAITAAQNTAALAKSKNISVHVFQTDRFNDQPLRALATGATGSYISLNRNTVVTDVSNVYAAINAQRTFYTVTYRSSLPDSGPRQITINAAQPTGLGTIGTYEVTINPPGLSITEPTPNTTVVRSAQPSADGTNVVFDKNSLRVAADLTWLDNPRLVTSVELLADGISQEVIQPAPDQTRFEFDWDISDITAEGVNSVQLTVRLTDELGLEATSQTTVNIEVVLPPPTPTPTPPLIPEIPLTVPDGAAPGIGVIIGVVCLGLLCVAPFPFLIFYLTRPTQAKKVVEDIRHTLIGGAPVKSKSLAMLNVIEGPKGMIGETVNITKAITTIGRNPKQADVVFYADSESSVSRLHCTIQMDGRSFKLTDNNSTSGTRLNGRRLQPNDPTELHDGDEIVLGDLGKLGVKLKFGFLMDKTQLPSSGTASDKTFIMDDFDKDDWDKFKG